MYGEGNWKADEEYREGLKAFSEENDAEELAREAAEEMDDDEEDEIVEEGLPEEPGSDSDEESEW
jgi:hypothetical protein